MKRHNLKYHWVRFWPESKWTITAFWEEINKKGYSRSYLRGFDWGSPADVEDFSNNEYEVGEEIPNINANVPAEGGSN